MRACAHPVYTALTDQLLLPAVLRRDPRAFAELLRRYRGLLYRCITRITGRYQRVLASEDLDEIFAEVCVALWADDLRRLRAFDPSRGMKLGSWLGLITNHATYDFLRRVARRPAKEDLAVLPDLVADDEDPLEELLLAERRAQLGVLTAELSVRDQEFVATYFGEDRDPEEVASALGISVKTVYSKKNKITTRLLDRAAELALAA